MPLRNYALTQFGGLNTEVSDFNLKDWEATAISNVDVDYRGYLRNRAGYSQIGNIITNTPDVLGLYKFYKDSVATPFFICGAGSKLYYLDGDNVWQGISGATSYSGARWNFISHQNKCYAANDADTPQVITASGSALTAASWTVDSVYDPPIEAPFIIEHRDRIFMAGGELAGNGTSKASRVMYTDMETPPDIDATGLTGIPVLAGDGQKITGISKLGMNLIITKKHQIHHISGCTSVDFTRRMIVPGKGCFAHRSLVNTGNTIIMLHDSGILNFNGQSIQDMSINFKSKIDGINSGYIQNACAVFYNKRYWLSYTSSGTSNDKILVVDALSGACTEYSFGVNAFYLDLANVLYGAGDDGFVYQLDNTQQDVSADITSYWQGKYLDFGMPGVTKRLKEVVVYCLLDSKTEHLDFTFYVDQGRQDWTKKIIPNSSSITEVRFSCARELVGKRFRPRVDHTGSEAYKIQQIIFRYEPIARKGVVV